MKIVALNAAKLKPLPANSSRCSHGDAVCGATHPRERAQRPSHRRQWSPDPPQRGGSCLQAARKEHTTLARHDGGGSGASHARALRTCANEDLHVLVLGNGLPVPSLHQRGGGLAVGRPIRMAAASGGASARQLRALVLSGRMALHFMCTSEFWFTSQPFPPRRPCCQSRCLCCGG